MAKRKDPSPLFEIIHNAGRPSEPNVRIPDWLRKQQEEQAQGAERVDDAASGAAESTQPAQQPAQPERSAADAAAGQGREQQPPEPVKPSAPVPADEAGPDAGAEGEPIVPQQRSASAMERSSPAVEPGGAVGDESWLSRPLVLRTTRLKAMVVALAGVLLFGAVFVVGREVGRRTAVTRQETLRDQAQGLRDAAGSVESGLVNNSVPGVEARAAGTGAGSGAVAVAGGDPREPGLNYFRLLQLPESGREAGERAVRFLQRNGVDAALLPIKNSDYLKLIALPGFKNPYSDPAAQRFKRKLQSLGREWKARHGGSTDWQDLYPEKYQPGKN